jgi:hypothetical protein
MVFDSRNQLEEQVCALINKKVDTSLLPLIFKRLDCSKVPVTAFGPGYLTRTASVICKFSALLIQAYWLMLVLQKDDERIPRHLNEHLLQIWAGNQIFTEGSAISVLQEATKLEGLTDGAVLARDARVFIMWGEHFAQRRPSIKSFLKSMASENWYAAFSRLIDALPILQTTSFGSSGFKFLGESEVPAFPFLHRSIERSRMLYLYDFDRAGTKIVFEDPYSDHTEDLNLQDHPDLNEQYVEIRRLLGLAEVRESVLYLFGSGYKHIERLAIAIANSSKSSSAVKKLLFQGRERVDVSPEMADEEVATLLLASDGPTGVLRTLLREDDELFGEYLSNLEEQTERQKGYWINLFTEMRDRKIANFQGYLEIDDKLKSEVIPHFELELKCWCVCKAAGFGVDDPQDYVEGIGIRLSMLANFLEAIEGNLGDRPKLLGLGIQIQKIVERTFRFLFVFYSGLQGYHQSLEKCQGDYQTCERAMLDAARRAHRESHKSSAAHLINLFSELCRKMNHKGPPDRLLGRPEVCKLKTLGTYANEDWMGVFNRLKHDTSTGRLAREVRSDELLSFADRTIKIFNYLQYGNEKAVDMAEAARRAVPLSQRLPVYPMVVSFREQHRKRDGLVVYSYKIHRADGFGADDRTAVNIMTPHQYIANEDYYCIPYHKRTTDKWLLDPFLIRCSKIDEILNESVD